MSFHDLTLPYFLFLAWLLYPMERRYKCLWIGSRYQSNKETKLAKSLCNNLVIKATLELADGICAPPFIDENMVAQKVEVAYPRSQSISDKAVSQIQVFDSLGSFKSHTVGIFGGLDDTGKGKILA